MVVPSSRKTSHPDAVRPLQGKPVMQTKLLTVSALAAAVTGAAVSPSVAHAQGIVGTSADNLVSADVGAYLSYTFGAGQRHLGWGLQGRTTYTLDACVGSDLTTFFGGVARLDFRGSQNPRILVGAQAGKVIGVVASAHGEIGLGYRFGTSPGVEATVGAGGSGLLLGRVHGDIDTLSGSTTVGLGLGSPYPPGGCFIVEGRPLRDANGFAELPGVRLIAGEVANREAAVWTRRAQTEWASVPTFFHLAEQLELVGAPRTLIEAALTAAQDEARHALMAAGVAARAVGGVIALDGVSSDVRPHMLGREALVRLATESWIDGCVGEGAAAACAARELEDATDPQIRDTQSRIRVEEAQHAELGWGIVQWCLSVGGHDVRHALIAQRDAHPSADEIDVDDAERLEVFEASSAAAQQRLNTLL